MSSPLHRLAEAACNRALALDPERDTILSELSGRRIGIRVHGMPLLDTRLRFSARGVSLLPGAEGTDVDAVVSGTPAALLSLLAGDGALPAAQGVEVRGDVGLLRQARETLARLRPDWHEPLARLLGDELGHPLARGLEHGFALLRRTARELHADAAEYLREESGLLATTEEVRDFAAQVDSLRDAVERLQKRVDRLPRVP